jgi:hypothetical protein
MAFTPTNLAITPLLDTTFISDMKLIINANTTLLQTQVEDVINELEIDLVNKYIGVDTPLNKVFTQDIVVGNSILFKAGSALSASTIASLTQSSGVSTFAIDNLTLSKSFNATAVGSKISAPTIVVGTDSSNISVTSPETTPGTADKGLYVGDATTPIKTRLYGEVEMPKQSIIQSYSSSGGVLAPRVISLIANGTDYAYAKLVLSRTDPQFIYVNLVFPSGYTNYGNSIWLLLHEPSSDLNRPAPGQTFTIIINKILDSNGTELTYADLPAVSNLNSAAGINIICGDDSNIGTYKRALINSATWTTVPTSDVNAVAAIDTDILAYYFRFGNTNMQGSTNYYPRESTFSFTKTEHSTDYSTYTITGSNNTVIINP